MDPPAAPPATGPVAPPRSVNLSAPQDAIIIVAPLSSLVPPVLLWSNTILDIQAFHCTPSLNPFGSDWLYLALQFHQLHLSPLVPWTLVIVASPRPPGPLVSAGPHLRVGLHLHRLHLRQSALGGCQLHSGFSSWLRYDSQPGYSYSWLLVSPPVISPSFLPYACSMSSSRATILSSQVDSDAQGTACWECNV